MVDPARRLKTKDLADLIGSSTQLVRNLEASGVLPHADRADNGYRCYTEVHVAALLAYRALKPAVGAGAGEIVSAATAGQLDRVLASLEDAHVANRAERNALAEVEAGLAAVAADEHGRVAGVVPAGGLRIGDVAGRLGVRPSALRVWERAGLISPGRETATGYRRYGAEDVRDARTVQLLRASGHLFGAIAPVVDALRREGKTEALYAAIAERRGILAKRREALLHGTARLGAYVSLLGEVAGKPS